MPYFVRADYRRRDFAGVLEPTRTARRRVAAPRMVHVVRSAEWSNPADVKRRFGSADILAGGRVVFDIGGNKYRLVVAIHYRGKRVCIRFIGTHAEYDRIEATTI